MDQVIGDLTFTCIKGNGYRYDQLTFAQAQHLLNERFDDPSRCTAAMFTPHAILMKPAGKPFIRNK